jgi:catechol 2,3-dioxygenase-like lactoylglutathione lyase family enzyme
LHFYGSVLGLKQGKSIPLASSVLQHRFFIGRHLLKINHVPTVSQQMPGGFDNAIGIRLLTLVFDELDPVLHRLRQAGMRHSPPVDVQGIRLCFTRDSDGNLLELVDLAHSSEQVFDQGDRMQIGLCVSDPQASKDFYGRILNFKAEPDLLMDSGKTRFGFRAGNTLVKFWQGEPGLANFSGEHFGKIGSALEDMIDRAAIQKLPFAVTAFGDH